MVDRLAVRDRTRHSVRREADQITDPPARNRRDVPFEVRSTLEIIHAQYHRELARAARGEPAERAGALAEVRRLLEVVVTLRGGVSGREVARMAHVAAERREPGLHGP